MTAKISGAVKIVPDSRPEISEYPRRVAVISAMTTGFMLSAPYHDEHGFIEWRAILNFRNLQCSGNAQECTTVIEAKIGEVVGEIRKVVTEPNLEVLAEIT
jgi:hypothetical protein